MPALRCLSARPAPLDGSNLATRWRTARVWQAQVAAPGKLQRAAYAIPPQDKHNDDLGGPYGQENPNPAERKKVNRYCVNLLPLQAGCVWSLTHVFSFISRSYASQTAIGLALVVGFGVIFSGFASPRAIAEHQINNDTQLGSFRSNTGSSLAEAKYGNGGVGGHALHKEQTTAK